MPCQGQAQLGQHKPSRLQQSQTLFNIRHQMRRQFAEVHVLNLEISCSEMQSCGLIPLIPHQPGGEQLREQTAAGRAPCIPQLLISGLCTSLVCLLHLSCFNNQNCKLLVGFFFSSWPRISLFFSGNSYLFFSAVAFCFHLFPV